MTRSRKWIRKFLAGLPIIAAGIAIGVASAVLLGWLLGYDWLHTFVAGQVSMKANTAVGFMMCGAVLLVARRPQFGGAALLTLRWSLELALLALGFSTLAQYLTGIDLGLDQFFAQDTHGAVHTADPGRMSPTTAVGFMLFAVAMIADHWRSSAGRAASRCVATVILVLAATSILGYVYGAPSLYLGIDGVTAMALPTALLFLVVPLGLIWLHPDYGFPALLNEESLIATQVRALLPMVVLAPLVVGALVAAGYGRYYHGQLAIALTALGSVLAAGIVAAVAMLVLRRAENALFIRDRALQAATSGVIITDHRSDNEPILHINRAFTAITGYSHEDVVGKNCRFMNEGVENPAEVMEHIRESVRSEMSTTVELRNKCKDGSLFWNRLRLAPVSDFEGVVTHFVGVVDDVTVKREQEARLRQALDDAAAANTMRDTFVRLISHELRTPMNAALTWIRLMELDDTAETRKKGFSVVAQSIESQSRLIDDLVDVTRFAAKGVSLEAEALNACELVQLTLDELRPGIESTHHLVFTAADGDYSAEMDRLRVQQMVRNLVTNAQKYTPDGGKISVELSAIQDQMRLRVCDSGKGMTAEQVGRIFEPFWRAEATTPGLGIGLFIVASLAEAHGGAITATSDGPDKGSCFELLLPFFSALSSEVPLGEKAAAGVANGNGPENVMRSA